MRSLDIAHLLDKTLSEDDINLLQRASSGLGIEEEDDGDEAGVDNGKDEVCRPANVRNHDGSNHDNDEVEQPVGAGRDRIRLSAGLHGVDLSGIEPWEWEPSGTENDDEHEQAENTSFGSLLRFGAGFGLIDAGGDESRESDDHGEALANCTPKEEGTTANSLNQEPGGS